MSDKKPKYPTMVSPKGVASFSHLHKPDTEGRYADNKFKTTILFPKAGSEQQEEIDKFLARIRDLHVTHRGKKKTESPVKDGDEKTKADGEPDERYAGKWYLTSKSKFAPQLLNARGKDLESGVEIRGGDIIRIAVTPVPYEEGKNAGISLQLNAVKLVEKRAGADYSGMFDDNEDDDGAGSEAGSGSGNGDFD